MFKSMGFRRQKKKSMGFQLKSVGNKYTIVFFINKYTIVFLFRKYTIGYLLVSHVRFLKQPIKIMVL